MRKYLLYLNIILILVFLIPSIFVEKENIAISNIKGESIVNKKEELYNYNSYGTIKLLHKDTNKVEEVKLDEYIKNVVSAEMPASFHIEALKAQAIVARTYTIYKIQNSSKHKNADICDKAECCQAWINKEDRLKKWV